MRINHLANWWAGAEGAATCRASCGSRAPATWTRSTTGAPHWVDTLHRWFDHWLHGRRQRDHGRAEGRHRDRQGHVRRRTPTGPCRTRRPPTSSCAARRRPRPARSALSSGGDTDTLSWTDAPGQSENTMINTPPGSQANRRVFLSPVLTHDLRISGTPVDRHPGVARQARRPTSARCSSTTAPATQVTRYGRRHRQRQPGPSALLGRVERQRQRVLHRGDQADDDRDAVARDQGHPRLLQPRLAARPPTLADRRSTEVPLPLADASRTTTCSRPATRSGSSSSPTTRSSARSHGTTGHDGHARHAR